MKKKTTCSIFETRVCCRGVGGKQKWLKILMFDSKAKESCQDRPQGLKNTKYWTFKKLGLTTAEYNGICTLCSFLKKHTYSTVLFHGAGAGPGKWAKNEPYHGWQRSRGQRLPSSDSFSKLQAGPHHTTGPARRHSTINGHNQLAPALLARRAWSSASIYYK